MDLVGNVVNALVIGAVGILLAWMLKGGFDRIEERFVGVEQRFTGVDRQFAGVDRQFAGVEQRFDQVEFFGAPRRDVSGHSFRRRLLIHVGAS